MSGGPLAGLPLVDAHCHPVLGGQLERDAFELWCTEADVPAPPGVSYMDSQLGFALRRWCAPVLDLPTGAPDWAYVAGRAELGWQDATSRLLRAAGLEALLVDAGLARPELLAPAVLGEVTGAPVREIVRLESVAEWLATSGVDAAGFADRYVATLRDATRDAVAVKSILAYRYGFSVDPARPTAAEVRHAAGDWLAGLRRGEPPRLVDEVLLRFVLWAGVDTGLPLQLHTGFGDRDVALGLANPVLLQPLLAEIEPTGVPVVLLHCYPYHREAGWLASVYPNVYLDVGLTVSQVGARAEAVLAEFCELAPFGKLMFSTDAYGLPELYCVGATQFRHSFGRLIDSWIAEGAMSLVDAERIAEAIGAANARRVYQL